MTPTDAPPHYVPSSNVAHVGPSATIAVSALAAARRAAGRSVIDLGAGEPDVATPAYIREAAHRALDAGATRYTAVSGIAPLREAIAQRVAARGRTPTTLSANDVVVSTGSKQALFNSCFAVFGPGDEVLIPTPAWTSYYEIVALARAVPVVVQGASTRSFKVTPSDLRAAASPRTRGVMLNSPCNPTGAVYTPEELAAIVRCAEEEGWWIISDEIYRAISYDGPALSVFDVCQSRERVIVVDGVAKAFAMTGWRIGWTISPPEVARAMEGLQSHTTSNATTLAQHAALAALTNPEAESEAVGAMVTEFRRRRDAALGLLRGAGATVIDPCGAFYLFMRVGGATLDDPEPGSRFAARLLEEVDVAVVPGSAFRAAEWIRISYAGAGDVVLEGVKRIIDFRRRFGGIS